MFGRELRRGNRALRKDNERLSNALTASRKETQLVSQERADWQRRAERHAGDAVAAERKLAAALSREPLLVGAQLRQQVADLNALLLSQRRQIDSLTATGEAGAS